jgi:tetratricopeptide (TPR) repeat protein
MGALEEMSHEDGVPEAMRDLIKTYLTQSSGTLNLADLAGFSSDELDACYAMACQKIAVGNLDEATRLFLLLCLLAHDRAKHWRGLGLTFHRRKIYESATIFYGLALKREPHDVIARAFNAECLLWMNKRVAARREAELAIEAGAHSTRRDDAAYVRRAHAVLARLSADDSVGEFVR